ncbi:MAG TPA: sulfite exporter TauE/SafE family protein [Rhodanobacteraceae bacterium]|nr:sulfite exporter TauE/SafE family protein [Rhodanobacteraceae bacterium]
MDDPFLVFVGIGFLAQLVDGALGMAYGLISNSVLLALGLPPALASATVHTAELATSGVSGLSHAWFRNVDWKLFRHLAIAGAIGGTLGATLLANVPGEMIRPFINVYLVAMGALMVARALGRLLRRREVHHPGWLGLVAGLLDAIGGGGWGALATSTLVARGHAVRSAIGSVSAAEFVVTASISITLVLNVGIKHWPILLGLLCGGVIAAPMAAWLVRHAPEKAVMIGAGSLVVLVSAGQLVHSWL